MLVVSLLFVSYPWLCWSAVFKLTIYQTQFHRCNPCVYHLNVAHHKIRKPDQAIRAPRPPPPPPLALRPNEPEAGRPCPVLSPNHSNKSNPRNRSIAARFFLVASLSGLFYFGGDAAPSGGRPFAGAHHRLTWVGRCRWLIWADSTRLDSTRSAADRRVAATESRRPPSAVRRSPARTCV